MIFPSERLTFRSAGGEPQEDHHILLRESVTNLVLSQLFSMDVLNPGTVYALSKPMDILLVALGECGENRFQ